MRNATLAHVNQSERSRIQTKDVATLEYNVTWRAMTSVVRSQLTWKSRVGLRTRLCLQVLYFQHKHTVSCCDAILFIAVPIFCAWKMIVGARNNARQSEKEMRKSEISKKWGPSKESVSSFAEIHVVLNSVHHIFHKHRSQLPFWREREKI